METLKNDSTNSSTSQQPTVGLFYPHHEDNSLNKTDSSNPILARFQKEDLISRCKVYEKIEGINQELLNELLGDQYLSSIEKSSPNQQTKLSQDASANNNIPQNVSLAANGIKIAVDEVLNGKIHHAVTVCHPAVHPENNKSQESSQYNDVALAAKYATNKLGLKKVVIFDWDVQFDSRTSKLFSNDPSVLYISIHRYDKGEFLSCDQAGDISNIGEGEGKGYNLNYTWNLPHKYYTIGENEYVYALDRIFLPIIKEFNPELILISAGFGAANGDPVGGLDLSVDGYAYMTKRFTEIGKTILALRTGNDLDLLTKSSEACLRILLGEQMPLKGNENEQSLEDMREKCHPNEVGFDAAELALDTFEAYWPVLTKDQDLLNVQKACQERSDSTTIEIAAGHRDAIIIKQDKIVKRLKDKEIKFYTELANVYEGKLDGIDYAKETKLINDLTAKCTGMTVINGKSYAILNNLCFKHPKASVIDFKLGSVTHSPDLSEEMKRMHIEKAEKTISSKLGFRVSGLILKDKKGEVAHKAYKDEIYYSITTENIAEYIARFLKSNDAEKINLEASEYYQKFLRQVIDFFEKNNTRAWIGTSILFVLDNTTNYYRAAWIDIGKAFPLKEGEKDENSLEGLRSLSKILHNLSNSDKN